MHPVYFAATFRRFLGSSVGEYLRRRRFQYARRKLADLQIPLTQVATDAGFTDQSHLTRTMHWMRFEPQSLDQKVELLRRFRAQFDLGQDFVYGIFNRDESTFLGATGLHPRVGVGAREIGYWLLRAHVGQGLATEAAAALTHIAFNIERVHRVEIHCAPDNFRSARVAEKLGYTYEATLRGHDIDGQGQPRDSMIWTLFAPEFAGTPAARLRLQAFDCAGRPLF